MAGAVKVKVDWIPAGCEELFKYNEEIASMLQSAGDAIAEKNSIAALMKMHSPQYVQPFIAEVRRLDHTQVCVVHATTRAVAAVGKKYGLPKK